MKRLIYVFATLICISGVAYSQHCFSSRVVVPVVKKDVVVKEVVEKVIVKDIIPFYTPVAVFAPFTAVVPTYGGSYIPPAHYPSMPLAPTASAPANTNPQPQASEMKQVLEILQGFDSRLRALEGKGGLPTSPPVPPASKKSDTLPPTPNPGGVSALNVMQNKCASCHETKNAAEKGGGFVMFDGPNLVRMSDLHLRKTASMIHTGRMPPRTSGISMTDEEVSVVMSWMDTLK